MFAIEYYATKYELDNTSEMANGVEQFSKSSLLCNYAQDVATMPSLGLS